MKQKKEDIANTICHLLWLSQKKIHVDLIYNSLSGIVNSKKIEKTLFSNKFNNIKWNITISESISLFVEAIND